MSFSESHEMEKNGKDYSTRYNPTILPIAFFFFFLMRKLSSFLLLPTFHKTNPLPHFLPFQATLP